MPELKPQNPNQNPNAKTLKFFFELAALVRKLEYDGCLSAVPLSLHVIGQNQLFDLQVQLSEMGDVPRLSTGATDAKVDVLIPRSLVRQISVTRHHLN